jgi:hypothetical protein
LEDKENTGLLNQLPKKEAANLKIQLAQLRKNLGGIKYMTSLPDIVIIIDQQKESYYPLFIHKSNVAMDVGVAANRGRTCKSKHLSTMAGKIYSTNVFQVGNTILESSFKANLHMQTFSQVLQRKNI